MCALIMSKSYGISIPNFFLNGDGGAILQSLEQRIKQQYQSVSISYETVNISVTSRPCNPLGRLYNFELNNVRLKYGFFMVYPTSLETSVVNDADVILIRNNFNGDPFYIYNHQGYIPDILRNSTFTVSYKTRGGLLDYSQYVNKHSILFMVIDTNNENDFTEISFYYPEKFETLKDIKRLL